MTNTMRMKLTMKRVRVAMRAIHFKSRRIKGEFNPNGHLQNFKKYLIYLHKTLHRSFVA